MPMGWRSAQTRQPRRLPRSQRPLLMMRDKLLFYCYIASFCINALVVSVLGYSRLMAATVAPLANPEATLHPVRLGVYKPPVQPIVSPTPPKPVPQHASKAPKNPLPAKPQATPPTTEP